MEYRVRRGGLVWPMILIAAGVVVLLNNLGIVSWNIWWSLARLWPVLLIAIGLDILVGRRSLFASLAVAVLVLAVLAGAAVYWQPQAAAQAQLHLQQIAQPLEGARDADISIDVGAASLTIREAQETASLVEGSLTLNGNEQVTPRSWRTGDTAHFELRPLGPQGTTSLASFEAGLDKKPWELRLNPDVPMRLKVNAGVGNSSLNLQRLKVTRLEVDGGVGNTRLTLPRAGQVSVTLDAGVGRLEVVVPAGLAVRMQVDRGLGGFDIQGDFQHNGDEYVSPGYANAADRADIRINGGIGHITVQQSTEN